MNIKARIGQCLLLLLPILGQSAVAETITIGKGKGVVWEGLPFSETLSGPLGGTSLLNISLLAISTSTGNCTITLTTINGMSAIKLADGVGLVPRLNATGYFTRYNNTRAAFSGTVGLPKTDMRMESGTNMLKFSWCFSPEGPYTADIPNYYSSTGARSINVSGNWAIVTDGTQKNTDNITLPPYYAGSYSGIASGAKYIQILPTSINLRISTLECTVNTPTQINFGRVRRDLQTGAELGKITNMLNTQCTQLTDRVDANINLQFRAISGLYASSPSKLSLNEGGGYITGEINNSVTGSGSCNATTGIPFDNTPLKIGRITSAQSSQNMTNQVTWRICSGGSELQNGDVTASTEMLVTFN
ncbi:hypothetical protein [Yersinia alsatica]|uniref:hypothetical protein n=1 Tax=Yersinia alsatica TaxID=2890317 RepID=UPI001F1BA9C1|nr:hypothetical protein [Yersinia alsatica]